MGMGWDKAVNKLIEAQSKEHKSETLYEFNRLVGRYRNEQSSYKKEVLSRFGVDGKILLPDGEGGVIELFQHQNSKSGLLVSEQVVALVEADIKKMGGLRSLKGYDDGNVQILYEKPNSTSHLAYEIHINQEGVIHYFCRCIPWEGYEAELHARGFSVTHVGLGTHAIESGLHMKGFAFWHEYMTPKAL